MRVSVPTAAGPRVALTSELFLVFGRAAARRGFVEVARGVAFRGAG